MNSENLENDHTFDWIDEMVAENQIIGLYDKMVSDNQKFQLCNNELTIHEITEQRDLAIELLAKWCVSIDQNGSGWDDWDEYYKDAVYREGPLRDLLDKAIEKEKQIRKL